MNKASPRFWNRIAKKYAKSPVPDQESYERKLKITQEYFTPEMEILEIGCGTGTTAINHAPYVKHILATDISENMLEIARSKADLQGVTNVSFAVAAIDDLAVKPASMDMVMAHSILHLVEDWNAVINRIFDWLKPGGLLVSSTICLADGFGFMRPIMPIGRALGLLPQVSFFSEEALVKGMSDAGFEIEQRWKPGKRKAVFIVARKPESGQA